MCPSRLVENSLQDNVLIEWIPTWNDEMCSSLMLYIIHEVIDSYKSHINVFIEKHVQIISLECIIIDIGAIN